MTKDQLYFEITNFNNRVTNERETRVNKFYYMQNDEALEKASFIAFVLNINSEVKTRFEKATNVIDLAFGSGNFISKILLENNLVPAKIDLNDKFLTDTNQIIKTSFEQIFPGVACILTSLDFFKHLNFTDKADLIIFNPTSGGKPNSKDYNKNGDKNDLIKTLNNIASEESLVIFNGKIEEFNVLFPSYKCVFRYTASVGNTDVTIAYKSQTDSFIKIYKNNDGIKEDTEQQNTSFENVNLDALEDSISLQIQKIKPPRDERALVNISEDPAITEEKIKNFAVFVESLPEGQKGTFLEAIGNQHLTNDDINILLGRKKSLVIFKTELKKSEWDEPRWQKFFEENSWIFGYGLNYQYLKILQKEAHISGVDLNGKNEVISDFLMGTVKFTVLVELKRPNTELFGAKIDRSESWRLSNDLNFAVSQILAQKAEWQIKSEHDNYDKDGAPIKQDTFDPKTILIIGSSAQYLVDKKEDKIKAKTFELYRRNSRNIEILTYDELYERADFIVNQKMIINS